MTISHFGGAFMDISSEDVDDILKIRFGSGVNEFWISLEGEYPCLAVMINGDLGSITYFPDDLCAGSQSYGGEKAGETVTFYTDTPEEETELDGRYAVSSAVALRAAREFVFTGKRPVCIEWVEL
ncbi:MAG: Imm1 family immunity protein [Huintestinicola sp.]